MLGTATSTLEPLGGFAHVVQSIRDILTTPKGSRVLRRDYGSDVPALLDRPMNNDTLVDFYMAAAEAVDLWEPRVRVERVQFVAAAADGKTELDLLLTYLEDGRTETARIAL